MGNYFERNETINSNMALLTFLRSIHFLDIQKVQKYVHLHYAATNQLSLGEFYDVYYAVLKQFCGDMFELLENYHNVDGFVDIYESQAVLIIFSNEDFSLKVKFISELFDLDQSQKLERNELILIFQTAIRSLCKIIGIKPPALQEIEIFVQTIFTEMDTNNDYTISYEELYNWLCNCYQIQDFMLKYAQVQTFNNAKKRTTQLFNEFLNCNDVWLLNYYEEAKKSFAKVTSNQVQTYSRVEEEFKFAYASFLATDINLDSSISMREFPYLIYAYEGVEVQDIKKRFSSVDADRNGQITLREWFESLKLNNGVELCINILRRLYIKHDPKRVGVMNNSQVVQLLKEAFNFDSHNIFLKGFQYHIDANFPLDSITQAELSLFIEQKLIQIFNEKSKQLNMEKEFQKEINDNGNSIDN